MNRRYLDTAELLVRVAPLVFYDDRMALKGGTAINLFIRDLPRLSVDLDLVLADHTLTRDAALASISDHLREASERLTRVGFETRIAPARGGDEARLQIRRGDLAVKVEVNHVMRGALLPVARARLASAARERLRADAELPLLHPDEIYGGKLVAALDRQHPRDLFDVTELFEHGGVTAGMRRCFVAYLACHNRPVHEVLFSTEKDLRLEYDVQFIGMTATDISLERLIDARTRLMRELPATLDGSEQAFLRSLVRAEPDCSLLGFPHLAEMPALRWKVDNLRKLRADNRAKFDAQVEELDRRLERVA